MTEARVPDWHVAVGRGIRPEEVYGVFRALLDDLPMSRTALAQRLGITQPAVSRWASGDTRPGVAEMRATLDAVADRVAEIQKTHQQAEGVVSLVEEAVQNHNEPSPEEKPLHTETRRKITERLAELLDEL